MQVACCRLSHACRKAGTADTVHGLDALTTLSRCSLAGLARINVRGILTSTLDRHHGCPVPAAPLAMIDGRPSSEYEPDPDRVDYFYLPQASAAVPAA